MSEETHTWARGSKLKLRWETQVSSPVAIQISVFLSTFNMGVRPRFVLRHGTLLFSRDVKGGGQASFQVLTGTSGLLLKCFRGIGSHLALRGESRGVSGLTALSLVFLWTFVGDLREPFILPQGSQASFQFVKGTSGFLLTPCRGIGPHLELRWKTHYSSSVVTRILGFLSSFKRGFRPRLLLGYEICFPLEL